MSVMKFTAAIQSALDETMKKCSDVVLVGVGLIDPKAVFGTLNGLLDKYGTDRVIEGPLAEQMLTGFTFGAATTGLRPVLIHHRVDFLPLTFDQIANHMAKWNYMFGGKQKVPCVVRGIVGRGWGNGPQHTQSLHGFSASIPGVKVVVPANALEAKGLLTSAIMDDEPVIYIDHRWLHGDSCEVPDGYFEIPIGKAHIERPGSDITIVAVGPMVSESVKAAAALEKEGVSAEVISLRTVRPIDFETVFQSVAKTRHLIVADSDWPMFGVASTIISEVSQKGFDLLKRAPASVTWPNHPVPATYALEAQYYPTAKNVVETVNSVLGTNHSSRRHLTHEEKNHIGVKTGPF